MKTKNLRINKKRLGALILAASLFIGGGVTLTKHLIDSSKNHHEIVSEAQAESAPYTYYYTTGAVTFVSNGNIIGYVNNEDIDLSGVEMPNYTLAFTDMYVNTDNAGIYLLPGFENECKYLLKAGDHVTLNAYSDDGWSVVNYYNENDELRIGFVNSSFLSMNNPIIDSSITNDETPVEESNVEVTIGKVNGTGVRIRSSMSTNSDDNIIGSGNTGDMFVVYGQRGDWYLIDFYGEEAYIYSSYLKTTTVKENELSSIIPASEVLVAKITGNNVNVRSSTSTKSSNNIIGFCDETDLFEIISREGDWYYVKYLNTYGYVHKDYVRETIINRKNLMVQKMVALKHYAPFYRDLNGNTYCNLPENQNILVLRREGDYYKVSVDNVIGYIRVNDTKKVTDRTIVVDLSRQIIKVYHNGIEVFRCHTITGRKSMQSRKGCFTIGHHMDGYTFPSSGIYNEKWIQVDGNRGFHPADANAGEGWQPKSHFDAVARDAYAHWAKGEGRTYPDEYGSHGCYNMMYRDILILFDLCDIGDNVLIIGQNDLIKYNLLSCTDNYIIASDDKDNLYVVACNTGAVLMVPAIEENHNNKKEEWSLYANNTIDYDSPKIKTLG